jgi:hypothetical protein
MADKWRNSRDEMKQKRAGKEIEKEGKIEEIVVQRQSSGKAQQYSRVEPREFVQFGEKDMSMENKYNMKGCLSEAFCVQNWSKHDL